MEKRTPLNSLSDKYGYKPELLNFKSGKALEKIASTTYIPNDLDKIIRDIQASPDKDSVYLYDRALGCGETYGPNNNGDWFGRDDLINHHDSFTKTAALYRLHKNTGPNIGKVMASSYNEKLDTVDLILKAPLRELSDDIRKLDQGFSLATSMGAKVEHDVCSICGKKSKSRGEYCSHLKYSMLKMFEDGRQVYAENPRPRFIDISLVVIPADPGSAVLRKIASITRDQYIKKTTERQPERGHIDSRMIKFAYQTMSPMDAIMTLHSIVGPLRPDEFQAIFSKNASLLVPNAVAKVTYSRVKPIDIKGKCIEKIANEIKDITTLEQAGEACYIPMSNVMRDAYLSYRIATKTVPGPFIV